MKVGGIVRLHSRKLGYRLAAGGSGWLPDAVKHVIVSTYNFAACRIVGHNWHPDVEYGNYHAGIQPHEICVDCGKRRWVGVEIRR